MSVRRRRAREFECVYHIMHEGNHRLHVCKHAFKSILGVGNTRLTNLSKKLLHNERVELDNRGRHGKQPKIDALVPTQIDTHIASFPTETSHYCLNRADKILNSELSVLKMWCLYLEKHEPGVYTDMFEEVKSSDEDAHMGDQLQLKPVCTYQRYLSHFTKSDLRFGKLAVDTCGTCDELQTRIDATADEERKRVLRAHHAP
jgi:hypothetical protein